MTYENRYFSKYDLKNMCYQIPIRPNDRTLTTFEANCKLLQFKYIPFRLAKAVEIFQRMVTKTINEDKLFGVFPYIADVSVAGNTIKELKDRSRKFEDAVNKQKIEMTLNEDKTVWKIEKITVWAMKLEMRKSLRTKVDYNQC